MSLNESSRPGGVGAVVIAEPVEAGQTVAQKIVEGFPEKYWDQLVEYSTTDPVIAEFTSDPTRFKDRDAVKKWTEKGRDSYTITDPTGEKLLGLYWFGPEKIHLNNPEKPEENFTFLPGMEVNVEAYPITNARRLYGDLRGAGQSSAIFKEVFGRFIKTKTFTESNGGVWTETSGHNERVIKVDLQNGFRKVTEVNGRGKIILVADKADLLARIPAASPVPGPRPGRQTKYSLNL